MKPLTNRLIIIAVAGLFGAFVFAGLIVLANIFYDMRDHAGDWVHTFSWCIMIPSLLVGTFTKEIPNAYVVNGVLGAFVFTLIAAFWQFVFKPLRHQSDRTTKN